MRMIILLCLGWIAVRAQEVSVNAVTVRPRQNGCAVSVSASGEIGRHRAFLLDGPPRLVIDIPGAEKGLSSVIRADNDFLKGIRTSQFSVTPPVVRIVLDLKKKARFRQAPGDGLTFVLYGRKGPRKTVCDSGRRLLLNMVCIPDGSFAMGSDTYFDEQPVRTVRMSSYWISRHEITNGQYARFLNDYGDDVDADDNKLVHLVDRPGLRFSGDSVTVDHDYEHHPVMNVTWYGAAMFCRFYGYRLPTEAEWEYACRGGSTTRFCGGDSAACLDRYAWYGANTGYEAMPVGGKDYNRFGLYDMHGNLWEWCADWYSENAYRDGPVADPPGPDRGAKKILRGGAWSSDPKDLRCANRNRDYPVEGNISYGFRCAADTDPAP